MKKMRFILFFLVLIFSSIINAEEPNWHTKLKEIKPLKSSREDVEKVFGFFKINKSFTSGGIEAVFYDTSEGELSIEYSAGKCSAEKKEGYNVEKGIVLNIIFFPNKEIKFSKFKVDESLLHKTRDGDDPPWHYINDKLGIDYAVQKGRVKHVKFYPPFGLEKLKCQ